MGDIIFSAKNKKLVFKLLVLVLVCFTVNYAWERLKVSPTFCSVNIIVVVRSIKEIENI